MGNIGRQIIKKNPGIGRLMLTPLSSCFYLSLALHQYAVQVLGKIVFIYSRGSET